MSILVWLVFGLAVVGKNVIGLTDPLVIVYALLALTVMRMLPVALALVGTGFDRVSVLFMGWFGPRGLASVVFVLLAIDALESAGVPSDPLGPVVAWTVVLSVILHGFSATPPRPLVRRLCRGLAGRCRRASRRAGTAPRQLAPPWASAIPALARLPASAPFTMLVA